MGGLSCATPEVMTGAEDMVEAVVFASDVGILPSEKDLLKRTDICGARDKVNEMSRCHPQSIAEQSRSETYPVLALVVGSWCSMCSVRARGTG